MENKAKIFCWHHGDLKRLQYYLSKSSVDCPSESFLTKNKLKPGDQIRFSVKVRNQGKGQIWAVAELVSSIPYRLQNPRNKSYPFGVSLKNVHNEDGTQLCMQYPFNPPPPMNPSGWNHV